MSSYHQTPHKPSSQPQSPAVFPPTPELHPKGPTKLKVGSSSPSQLDPDPAKQVFLAACYIQPRLTNAATPCSPAVHLISADYLQNSTMRVDAIPTPCWLSGSAEVMSRKCCWSPLSPPPSALSPHLQGQVMRLHHSERGGGPEDLGGGSPSLLKAFGKQRGPEPAVQYHFPQKPPADSGMKRGRGGAFTLRTDFPGHSGFLWGFYSLCVGVSCWPVPSSVMWGEIRREGGPQPGL